MKKLRLTINVYDFSDYREFLLAAYEDLREQNPAVSYRFLQKRAGYSVSSNHFWQKASGRSPLGQQAAHRYARALGLPAKQSQFFETLAAMNQAKTDTDREFYLEQLRQYPGFNRSRADVLTRHEYYSNWYLSALRALVTLDDFSENPNWIAKKLSPAITPKQAREGIDKLLALGFLRRTAKGRLVQTEPFIGGYENRQDEDPVAKLALRNYHRKMIELASDSIDGQAQKNRYIIGSTLGLSKSQASKIREVSREFMHKVEKIVAQDEPIETILRVNLQLFPIVDGECFGEIESENNHIS